MNESEIDAKYMQVLITHTIKVNFIGEKLGQKVVCHMSKKFSYLGAFVAWALSPLAFEKSIIAYLDSSSSGSCG